MALALNGFKALRRIGKHESLFSGLAPEANKAARALLTRHMKAKSTDLKSVRQVCEVLGNDLFSVFIDGMSDAEVKAVLTRLDKHHPEFKDANADWRRKRLSALSDGEAEPFIKKAAAKTKKTKPASPAKEPERLQSEAMAAVRRK